MSPKKIYLLDDEPAFMRAVIDRIEVEFNDMNMLYFSSSWDFYNSIKVDRFEDIKVIILDLMLTIISDKNDDNQEVISLAKRIRKLSKKVPIIFFSILSKNSVMAKECALVKNSIFINKLEVDGIEKLIKYISTIK